jgi:hypothetical protein
MKEHRIVITEAFDQGVHPPFLFGRFQRNELVWAMSSETRSWH